MAAEPLIQWSDPIREFVGFLGIFLSAGPIGFRYFALHGRRIESDRPFYDDAARRAAMLGVLGVVLSVIVAALQVPELAARRHVTAAAFIAGNPATAMEFGFLIVALIGYLLGSSGIGVGWPVAAVGVVVGALRSALLGKWTALVNPIHSLAAGLWLGTLFVLVVAGLSALLRHEPSRERRGAIAADMVNGFSPLALTMGGVVVVFGLITAWRHLHKLQALWTTPYGYTLIVKLVFVALVFLLGAWNWRRQRPILGTEPAAAAIRRSSAAELTVATIVLIITAVLVSLPSPKG